eukprot:2029068-Amphidinium_carterae.1
MRFGGLTAESFFTGDNIGEDAAFLQQMPDVSALRRDTITSDAQVNHNDERTYTFYLESDDGSLLYMDAGLVVDHDGRHAMTTKSSTVALIAGWHSLVLDFFQYDSNAAMIMSYSGPDTGEEIMVIPSCALTPSVV